MLNLARFMEKILHMKWNLKFDNLYNEMDQILSGIPCDHKNKIK